MSVLLGGSLFLWRPSTSGSEKKLLFQFWFQFQNQARFQFRFLLTGTGGSEFWPAKSGTCPNTDEYLCHLPVCWLIDAAGYKCKPSKYSCNIGNRTLPSTICLASNRIDWILCWFCLQGQWQSRSWTCARDFQAASRSCFPDLRHISLGFSLDSLYWRPSYGRLHSLCSVFSFLHDLHFAFSFHPISGSFTYFLNSFYVFQYNFNIRDWMLWSTCT